MSEARLLQSGKGHRDENFPVASFLIAPRHRTPVLAFYRFARFADDIADHPTALPAEKLRLLEEMRASLAGESTASPEAVALRAVLAAHDLTDQHALDLLEAFRRDVTKLRTRDWDDLIDYCRYSAMPVGRFVLDVHGESRDSWPANDALCAALQIINHLQDCAKDYRDLNRVYIPEDVLAEKSLTVAALAQSPGSAALKSVIAGLAGRNALLLAQSRPFARQISDGRLALEVDLIQTLAEDLNAMLSRRDPLSENVHHSKTDIAALFVKRLPGFAPVPDAAPSMSKRETLPASQAAAVKKKASGSSFYLAMRVDAEAGSATRCSRSTPFAAGSTTSPMTAWARGPSGMSGWKPGATIWKRCMAARRRRGWRFWRQPWRSSACASRISSPSWTGWKWDVAEDIVAPDLATLDLYCERVASAVGRLSIKVFGMDEGPGLRPRPSSGRALQLTNILRDIDEDADIGRLYLPREYLFAAGSNRWIPRWWCRTRGWTASAARVAAMAHAHYDKAAAILAKKPKGRIATPRLMGAVYGEILKATEAAGFAPPRHRVSLSRGKLLSLLLRAGLG